MKDWERQKEFCKSETDAGENPEISRLGLHPRDNDLDVGVSQPKIPFETLSWVVW